MAVPVDIDDDEFTEVPPDLLAEIEYDSIIDFPPDLLNLLYAAELGDPAVLHQALADLNGSINDAGEDGDTALHLACLYGHLNCVQILLEAGASLNVSDEDGSLPLHDACAGGYCQIVEVLLTAAKNDEQLRKSLLETCDIDGDTPLHHAARGHHVDVVELLLSYGASPRSHNAQGKMPSELADEGSDVQQILRRGTDECRLET